MRQHRRPSVPRRNRLTPRPSGRLRRRLTQALGPKYAQSLTGQNSKPFTQGLGYRHFVLVCRLGAHGSGHNFRCAPLAYGVYDGLGTHISNILRLHGVRFVVYGRAHVRSRNTVASPSLTTRSRRTAAPPLNSSVRPQ